MILTKELKNKAKEQIRGNLGILFLCNVAIYGISFFLCFIPIVGIILSVLVTPVLIYGINLIYLNFIRENNIDVQRIFGGFYYFVRSFCVGFFKIVLILIWSLLLFIPGIIKAIAYSMSYYIAIDETDLSAMESIKESEKIMAGYKMKYFLLLLSFIPWILLIIITLGAVGVYVIPYFNATKANFYNVVKEQGNMYS